MSDRESNTTQDFRYESTPWLVELKKVPEPYQFLPLLAVVLPKISTFRVFEANNQDRAKLLEVPLPTADDLSPLIEELFRLPERYAQLRGLAADNVTASLIQSAYRALQKALSPEVDGATDAQDTTLDFIVDQAKRSWSLEIGSRSELRGQSLAELRASSRDIPAPTAVPKFDPPHFMYMSAAEAAKLLGVAKSTVTRRIERNEIIGFRVFKRKLYIPREQFMDLDVVPGVPEVLQLFSIPSDGKNPVIDHKNAWVFLAGSFFHGDLDRRPIDRLRTAARNHDTQRVLVELTQIKRSLDWGDHV